MCVYISLYINIYIYNIYIFRERGRSFFIPAAACVAAACSASATSEKKQNNKHIDFWNMHSVDFVLRCRFQTTHPQAKVCASVSINYTMTWKVGNPL